MQLGFMGSGLKVGSHLRGSFLIRVPYYIGDPIGDPNLESHLCERLGPLYGSTWVTLPFTIRVLKHSLATLGFFKL